MSNTKKYIIFKKLNSYLLVLDDTWKDAFDSLQRFHRCDKFVKAVDGKFRSVDGNEYQDTLSRGVAFKRLVLSDWSAWKFNTFFRCEEEFLTWKVQNSSNYIVSINST